MQTKRILKLYALKCIQGNNQNRKHKTTLPPCLDKELLFKVRKKKEKGKGKQKRTISPS